MTALQEHHAARHEPDRLIRGYFPGHGLRFSVSQTAALCSEAATRHQADWLAALLLGEALTCATLMSVQLKGTEKFTLRWIYPGPVGTILADCTEQAQVRGFPQRLRIMDAAGTVEEAIGGDGRVSAITSTAEKVLHTGITEGVFRNVPRDMSHLISLSFQVETAMAVGLVLPPDEPLAMRSAAGVMLQPLPGADLEFFDAMRGMVDEPGFQAWLEDAPRTLEEIIERITPEGDEANVLGEIEPRFECACSRSKVESVLRMFDPEELQDMIEKEGGASINCHFCATSYTFNRSEIETLIDQSQSGHA